MRRTFGSRQNGSVLPAGAAGTVLAVLMTANAAAGPYAAGEAYRRHDGTRWVQTVDHRRHAHKHRHVHKRVVVVKPRRRYKNVWVVRPHGHRYRGYAHYHDDALAYRWLGFTAITLVSLDRLSVAQQRRHETAQISATTAPVGETIHWKDDTVSGSVRVVREGTSSSGRYCREFQQKITIGGKSEDAYGTACQQPDGAWEILP